MRRLPVEEISRLGFLLQPHAGDGIYLLPDGDRRSVHVVSEGKWDSLGPFLRFELFAEIEGVAQVHHQVLFTYNTSRREYRAWSFAPHLDKPLELFGDFVNGSLIMHSEPTTTLTGLEQLRVTYTPHLLAGIRIVSERFRPDLGFESYWDVMLEPAE